LVIIYIKKTIPSIPRTPDKNEPVWFSGYFLNTIIIAKYTRAERRRNTFFITIILFLSRLGSDYLLMSLYSKERNCRKTVSLKFFYNNITAIINPAPAKPQAIPSAKSLKCDPPSINNNSFSFNSINSKSIFIIFVFLFVIYYCPATYPIANPDAHGKATQPTPAQKQGSCPPLISFTS
jgi:hypothetical protein